MLRSFVSVGLVMVALVGCSQGALPTLTSLKDEGGRVEIRLAAAPGFAAAKGKAKYKNEGGEREFQVEVENARVLTGKTLGVFVNGTRVGGARVNRFGEGRLELNSDRGQRVPSVRSGTRVQVKTSAGKAVVAGQF